MEVSTAGDMRTVELLEFIHLICASKKFLPLEKQRISQTNNIFHRVDNSFMSYKEKKHYQLIGTVFFHCLEFYTHSKSLFRLKIYILVMNNIKHI